MRENGCSESWFLSMGDQPATLPAMIPAMTAVAPKAEFERERVDLGPLRESGVGFLELKLFSRWTAPFGVDGIESRLEWE